MSSSNQAKEALREKKDLLQKHDENLLGKKFRNHIVEVTKTRKTTIEAYSAGKSKSGKQQKGTLSRSPVALTSAKGESCEASDYPHQRLQLSKQQTKMTATKLPFEPRIFKHFYKNWELITGEPDILALIKGFKIPFLRQHVQDYVPRIPEISKAQRELVRAEIETMLRKGAISFFFFFSIRAFFHGH